MPSRYQDDDRFAEMRITEAEYRRDHADDLRSERDCIALAADEMWAPYNERLAPGSGC